MLKRLIVLCGMSIIVMFTVLVMSNMTAMAQTDYPAHSLAKPGYTLTWNDEFNGTSLDSNNWINSYFPGRFSNFNAYTGLYDFASGSIIMRADATDYFSGIQTYNTWQLTGLPYYWSQSSVPTVDHFKQFYGYYEARFKSTGTFYNASFWAIQARTHVVSNDDTTWGEVDFNEEPNYGRCNTHLAGVTAKTAYTYGDSDLNYYIDYGVEIDSSGMHLYVDDVKTCDISIDWSVAGTTPWMFLLGMDGDMGGGTFNGTGRMYVDYFRAYTRSSTSYKIKNVDTGKVLDINGATQGADGILWTDDASTGQVWTIPDISGGSNKVFNTNHSTFLLDINGTTSGSTTSIWTDTGNSGQQWEFVSIGSGYYKIVNTNHSSLVLDIGGTTDGSHITVTTDSGASSQRWQLVAQ